MKAKQTLAGQIVDAISDVKSDKERRQLLRAILLFYHRGKVFPIPSHLRRYFDAMRGAIMVERRRDLRARRARKF